MKSAKPPAARNVAMPPATFPQSKPQRMRSSALAFFGLPACLLSACRATGGGGGVAGFGAGVGFRPSSQKSSFVARAAGATATLADLVAAVATGSAAGFFGATALAAFVVAKAADGAAPNRKRLPHAHFA